MQNDYQDEFEGQEGSEYHFTDDEINYEGEDEAKTSDATSAVESPKNKENIVSKLMHSRRLIISGAVFLFLVFAVYKMVSPTSTEPSTIIATAPPVKPVAVAQSDVKPPVTPTPVISPNQTAPTGNTTVAVAKPVTPIAEPQTLPPVPDAVVTQQTANMQPYQQVVNPPAAGVVTVVDNTAKPGVTAQPTLPQGQIVEQQQSKVYAPTQSPASTVEGMATAASNVMNSPGNPAFIVTNNTNIEAKLAQMVATSERLIGQLQGQYTQQYNDFANQTRAIQEQVQAMSARVSVIEGQLNQLIQALTKKNALNQQGAMNDISVKPTSAPEVKVAYNVQAIIPGRAWLKSDNGETLTVAEGDTIKGVGKITKIDPYDGVVELNTGTKSISLSYGENA